MKEYFIRLFEYDRYTSRLMLELIAQVGYPEKPVKLMAHMLGAQQIWLSRCKALPPPTDGVWPDWPASSLSEILTKNSEEWLGFLNGLQPGDFDKIIAYKNSRGDAFENRLADIMTQVTNHGTHHRAQIGQYLLAAGIGQLPTTDYIFYLRESDKA